jgi:hypothetical protein
MMAKKEKSLFARICGCAHGARIMSFPNQVQ